MNADWRRLIEAIHRAPVQCVLVATGGGASAISDLLVVPGGSRTVLEAVVPYSAAALADWLGRPPDQYCSEDAALAMAAVAYDRGCRLAGTEDARQASTQPVLGPAASSPRSAVAGVSCTASLVSDRPKKGEHRCHVALQTVDSTLCATLVLEKGARDRAGEEAIVRELILLVLARGAGIGELPAHPLRPGDTIVEHRAMGDPALVDLRQGERKLLWSLPTGTYGETLPAPGSAAGQAAIESFAPPRGILPGAFNPLHHGHEELRKAAESLIGGPVYFELSLRNVDKPALDYLTIDRRRAQFTSAPLALTNAPTFDQKAEIFPGAVFVIGFDTAERIIQPRYYGGSDEALRAALARVRDAGCRFLVAGRKVGDRFRTVDDLAVPGEFAGLFSGIPADTFRADISSTELRERS
jgi:hypothetical protein